MSLAQAPTRIGELEVIRRIGAGGFGVVYLATDHRLARQVALKIAHPGRGDLWREARAAARLAHPNVVTIYEIGDHDGSPYLVMEYVDGPTLRDRIERERLALPDALRIARDLAAAIAAAHREGIIHLDLTPSNVLLAPDGRARVVDFGLARTPEAASARIDDSVDPKKSTAAGTPTYMAPEQWRVEKLGPPADVWALGAITHMLVTGRPPVDGSAELVRERVAGAAALELAISDLPNDLTRLIRRCLDKDPAARPVAAEVAAELETLLARVHQPVPFREISAIGRDDVIAELVALVGRERVVTITGPSGAGKSAVVQRVTAALRADGWKVAAVQLGGLATVASSLRASVSGAALATRDDLGDQPTTVEDQVALWSRAPERFAADLDDVAAAVGRFALVIDPLTTLEPSVAHALAAAIADDGAAHLVFVVRDDRRDALASQLGDLGHTYALPPPARAALTAMLEQPVHDAGYRFDDGLVATIVADIAGEATAAARVQTIGAILWERRDREARTIPRTAYTHRRRGRWLALAAALAVIAAVAGGFLYTRKPDARAIAAGPQCAPYFYPKATISKMFNAPALQDALVGVSADGRSALTFRRDCRLAGPWQLILTDDGTDLDLSRLPALEGLRYEEGWTTMTGDALTVITANPTRTGFVASSRTARGAIDFTPLAVGPFAAITVTAPVEIAHPAISQDGLELFYTVLDPAAKQPEWIYHSTRSSTKEPFPAGVPLPDALHGNAWVNGISADRLALFVEKNYFVRIFTRASVNDPFVNPNGPTYAPSATGFRTRPLGDCTTLIGTCTSGCNNEETCIFSRN